MRIFENAGFNFIGNRTKAYMFSAVLILISIGSLATRGVQYGIDFKGGKEVVVQSDQIIDVTRARSVLADALEEEPEVKSYTTDGHSAILVRTASTKAIGEIESIIKGALEAAFAGSNVNIVKSDTVGPRFAEDLKEGAIYSIFGSLLVIFLYVLMRFEWRYSMGAVAALAHDVIITLGMFSLLQGIVPFSVEINQVIIAAFLTIVGYSLNDTVVVFDRIREYSLGHKTTVFEEVANTSINQTLSRTLITSGTTLLVVLTLFILGGEVLQGFAFALIIGILVGTYSSIFVATPVLVELRNRVTTK